MNYSSKMLTGVRQSLELSDKFYDSTKNEIELTAHVDGLPLFRSSPVKFWPILGCIDECPIFIIALYKGLKDPKCASTYLKNFIDEIIPYFSDGICVYNKVYKFHLVCILADAPARAFLLGILVVQNAI